MSFVVGLQYTATKFQLRLVLTMTKQEKLLARLLKIPPPKDLTRNEFETCLVSLGFIFQPTAGGGSHNRFVSEKRFNLVFLHLPSASPSHGRCQAPPKQRHLAANQPNALRSL